MKGICSRLSLQVYHAIARQVMDYRLAPNRSLVRFPLHQTQNQIAGYEFNIRSGLVRGSVGVVTRREQCIHGLHLHALLSILVGR